MERRGKITSHLYTRWFSLEAAPKQRFSLGEALREQEELSEALFAAYPQILSLLKVFLGELSGNGLPLKTCEDSLIGFDRVIPTTLSVEQGREIQRRLRTEVPHHSRHLPSFDRTLDVPLGVRRDSRVEQLGPRRLTLRLDIEFIRGVDLLCLVEHCVRLAVLLEPHTCETRQYIMNRIPGFGLDAEIREFQRPGNEPLSEIERPCLREPGSDGPRPDLVENSRW